MQDTPHVHVYDAAGRRICCDQEEKIQSQSKAGTGREYLPALWSAVVLLAGITFDTYGASFFRDWIRAAWYVAAYLPVGFPVLRDAARAIGQGEFFTEFALMGLATIGAFSIGEYPEGVAVMLFYAVGELFQSAAVRRAKNNIKALLDVRPETATVLRGGDFTEVPPDTVQVGETIRVRPGDRVPLDGLMLSSRGSFDTAALTGESRPRTLSSGDDALAGMINIDSVVELKVSKPFGASSLARILELVQNAAARKAPTELFIRSFARIYTPIVVGLAVLMVIVPYFLFVDYSLRTWLYRALIFLVISCPCALVISIPLGYFGGIGAASRNGLLFKGSSFLDLIARVSTVVMDKTGTLTRGVFRVQEVAPDSAARENEKEILRMVAALEQYSTHPIANALIQYVEMQSVAWKDTAVHDLREVAGHGLIGTIEGRTVAVGNTRLLAQHEIHFPGELNSISDTVVAVAIDGRYVMHLVIADELKDDAQETITSLRRMGVRKIAVLSGDRDSVVQNLTGKLGVDVGYGDLLPEDKVERLQALKLESEGGTIAFVGDGLNDAPVLALADVGIAMGGLGSDAAIETADIVIQTDDPSKVVTAVRIGRATRRVVWQNISLAFGVKAVVLILGAGGLATMWEAVFADVGVALLAILNAVRLQKVRFQSRAEMTK